MSARTAVVLIVGYSLLAWLAWTMLPPSAESQTQPRRIVVFQDTDPQIIADLQACGFEVVPPTIQTTTCIERSLAGIDTTGCQP